MKPYLDTEDTFYFNYEELIKPSKIITNLAELKAELEPIQKSKRDYVGIGAIIFTFTVLSIVIGLSIYTEWQIAYGQVTTNQREEQYNESLAYKYGNTTEKLKIEIKSKMEHLVKSV